MLFIQKNFRSAARLAMLAAPIALVSCAGYVMHPSPMPTGYTYHNDLYKAPPGADPLIYRAPSSTVTVVETTETVHYEGSGAAEMIVPVEYEVAAEELFARIEVGFGRPEDPVFVRIARNEAESYFAQALSQTLRQRGYRVADGRGQGPFTLDYVLDSGQFGDPARTLVTLNVLQKDHPVAQESGIYSLPVWTMEPVAVSAPMAPTARVMEDESVTVYMPETGQAPVSIRPPAATRLNE